MPDFLRNAAAIVLDREAGIVAVDIGAHLDAARRRNAVERMLAVDEEIGRHLRQMIGVAHHQQHARREVRVDLYAAAPGAIGGDLQRRAG